MVVMCVCVCMCVYCSGSTTATILPFPCANSVPAVAETDSWLHNKGVSVLEWPPYSPDLNHIEHVWADLKRCVEVWNPKGIEELKLYILREWKATTPEF